MALRKEQNGQTKQGKQTQNKNIIVGKTTQPNHPSDHRISQHRSTRLEVIITGIASRAVRNISRRKMRALLVVIALGFSLAILVAVPAGISANQSATQNLTANLSSNMAQSLTMLNTTITQTEASINQTMTEIDCSLTPSPKRLRIPNRRRRSNRRCSSRRHNQRTCGWLWLGTRRHWNIRRRSIWKWRYYANE